MICKSNNSYHDSTNVFFEKDPYLNAVEVIVNMGHDKWVILYKVFFSQNDFGSYFSRKKKLDKVNSYKIELIEILYPSWRFKFQLNKHQLGKKDFCTLITCNSSFHKPSGNNFPASPIQSPSKKPITDFCNIFLGLEIHI